MIKAKPMENRIWLQTRRSHTGGEEKRCWDTGGARAKGAIGELRCVASDQSALGCPESPSRH